MQVSGHMRPWVGTHELGPLHPCSQGEQPRPSEMQPVGRPPSKGAGVRAQGTLALFSCHSSHSAQAKRVCLSAKTRKRGWTHAWPKGTLALTPQMCVPAATGVALAKRYKMLFISRCIYIYLFTVENMGNAKKKKKEQIRHTWFQPAIALCCPDSRTRSKPFEVPGFSSPSPPASRSGADGADTPRRLYTEQRQLGCHKRLLLAGRPHRPANRGGREVAPGPPTPRGLAGRARGQAWGSGSSSKDPGAAQPRQTPGSQHPQKDGGERAGARAGQKQRETGGLGGCTSRTEREEGKAGKAF